LVVGFGVLRGAVVLVVGATVTVDVVEDDELFDVLVQPAVKATARSNSVGCRRVIRAFRPPAEQSYRTYAHLRGMLRRARKRAAAATLGGGDHAVVHAGRDRVPAPAPAGRLALKRPCPAANIYPTPDASLIEVEAGHGNCGTGHGPVVKRLTSWSRAPKTRFLVAVSIGVVLGIASYFQFGHHSLTHHNRYLSFVFGIGVTAAWVAISTRDEKVAEGPD